MDLSAEAASNQASAFVATAGLDWVANVTNGDWITLIGTTSGNLTTGNPQNITFDVEVNPSSTQRSGEVDVRAGDETDGPTGPIIVNQSVSSFDATGATTMIDAEATSVVFGSVIATTGLGWTISPETSNGITVSPTNGNGNETLTFTASKNIGRESTGSFIVAVTDAEPARTVTITAKQAPGGAFIGNLQIQKSQSGATNWSSANSYCNNLTEDDHSDWYLPSVNQLQSMFPNQSSLLVVSGFHPFFVGCYWSNQVSGRGTHYYVDNPSCQYSYNSTDAGPAYIRCVRNN